MVGVSRCDWRALCIGLAWLIAALSGRARQRADIVAFGQGSGRRLEPPAGFGGIPTFPWACPAMEPGARSFRCQVTTSARRPPWRARHIGLVATGGGNYRRPGQDRSSARIHWEQGQRAVGDRPIHGARDPELPLENDERSSRVAHSLLRSRLTYGKRHVIAVCERRDLPNDSGRRALTNR